MTNGALGSAFVIGPLSFVIPWWVISGSLGIGHSCGGAFVILEVIDAHGRIRPGACHPEPGRAVAPDAGRDGAGPGRAQRLVGPARPHPAARAPGRTARARREPRTRRAGPRADAPGAARLVRRRRRPHRRPARRLLP